MTVDVGKLTGLLPPECDGVIVNPMGVKVQLRLEKRSSG